MAEVIWSPAALDDVDEIAAFIARDSPAHAALFVAGLMEATDRLEQFPESGRTIEELDDPSRREIIVPPYRVMYLIADQQVWITGVVHDARE